MPGFKTYSYRFLIEVEVADVPALPCDEIGPVTRINVSGYQRTRGHLSRLLRGEKRCLVVNFNGAIAKGRTLASVTWRTNDGHALAMSDGRINGREAIVTLRAQNQGRGTIRCEATLDNGEVIGHLVMVHVQGNPWFSGESSAAAGVGSLTVTA